MSYEIHNKKYLPFYLNKVKAYFSERSDEASHEFELFCRQIGFKTQQRGQEQRRSISWENQMTDGELDGRDAEIQTSEHFMNYENPNDSLSVPINQTNPIRDILRGSKQDVDSSQYQNLLGLTPPDEIDMLFSDTQSNESIPKNSIFYTKHPTRDTPDSGKRVSFFKNKYEARIANASNIPKQTPSPIRKQKPLSVLKRSSSATQTPSSLRERNIKIDSYDIERRLTKLEEEVPIVQNRVYRLLNGQMIEPEAYSVTKTPSPLPRRVSNAHSVSALSSNATSNNSTLRTPSHSMTQNSISTPSSYQHHNNSYNTYHTPKTPGSVMNDINMSPSNYHHQHHYNHHQENRFPNTPTSAYSYTASSNTSHDFDIRSVRRTLKPTKQHQRFMRRVLFQMALIQLRKTDKIMGPNGKMIPNPIWEEIYSPKWRDV